MILSGTDFIHWLKNHLDISWLKVIPKMFQKIEVSLKKISSIISLQIPICYLMQCHSHILSVKKGPNTFFAVTVYFWNYQLTKWVKPRASYVANKPPDTRLVCYYLCNFMSIYSYTLSNEWKGMLGCWKQPSLNSVPAWCRYFPALRKPRQMPCYGMHNQQK